jgi:hypothetical protein
MCREIVRWILAFIAGCTLMISGCNRGNGGAWPGSVDGIWIVESATEISDGEESTYTRADSLIVTVRQFGTAVGLLGCIVVPDSSGLGDCDGTDWYYGFWGLVEITYSGDVQLADDLIDLQIEIAMAYRWTGQTSSDHVAARLVPYEVPSCSGGTCHAQ